MIVKVFDMLDLMQTTFKFDNIKSLFNITTKYWTLAND